MIFFLSQRLWCSFTPRRSKDVDYSLFGRNLNWKTYALLKRTHLRNTRENIFALCWHISSSLYISHFLVNKFSHIIIEIIAFLLSVNIWAKNGKGKLSEENIFQIFSVFTSKSRCIARSQHQLQLYMYTGHSKISRSLQWAGKKPLLLALSHVKLHSKGGIFHFS